MYIDRIAIRNFRTFRETEASFQFPEREGGGRPLDYPNVNLLLGNNGMGKSAALKAVALALMTPVIESTGYRPYSIVRRDPESKGLPTEVTAEVVLNGQDLSSGIETGEKKTLRAVVERKATTELIKPTSETSDSIWEPMYDEKSAAFFFVGYGASRTVESSEKADPSLRFRSRHLRYDRVAGLFEEFATLIPLMTWLPELKAENPGRHKQVFNLINRLLPDTTRFLDEVERGEFLFRHRGLTVPFRALSDGFQAYIGWIGDLLYHVCFGCPRGMKLVDNRGIVLVDEIDLHLHPEWQLSVLPTISRTLPNLQFICTTHSPIVAGTVESANLLLVCPDGEHASILARPEIEIHGLTADQILMSSHFGLVSTRAPSFYAELEKASVGVSRGEPGAGVRFMKMVSLGAGADDLADLALEAEPAESKVTRQKARRPKKSRSAR